MAKLLEKYFPKARSEPPGVRVHRGSAVKGDPAAVVDGCRDALRQNTSDSNAVANAIESMDTAIAQVKDHFAACRERGLQEPQVSVTKAGAKVRFPVTPVAADSSGYGEPVAPDPWDLMVSLHPELEERALARVRAFYADYEGLTLSPSERRKRLNELAAERLEIERLECDAIWLADANGQFIAFRTDTDLRAVLGVDGGPTPRRA